MRRLVLLALLMLPLKSDSQTATGPFGALEFRADNLSALPKWQRVLEHLNKEQERYDACAQSARNCTTAAMYSWRRFLREQEGQSLKDQLVSLNRFVNRWPYLTDQQAWGVSDYWATPLEFMDKSGDCEDYAILKYVTLRRMGVPADQLRVVVVQDTVRDLAHAVLMVQHDDDYFVLDSLFNAVLPDEQVRQYKPYYSVNENSRWAHAMPLERN